MEVLGEGLVSKSNQLVRDTGDAVILLDRVSVEGLSTVIRGTVQNASADPIADASVQLSSIDLEIDPLTLIAENNGEFEVKALQSPRIRAFGGCRWVRPSSNCLSVGPAKKLSPL